MKYYITLAHPSRDHTTSQDSTWLCLRKAGFTNLRWNMSTGKKNGDSMHRWFCEGDTESLVVLRLSADVEKVEEIIGSVYEL